MVDQVKGVWLRSFLKSKVWALGLLVFVIAACGGGGGGGEAATPAPQGGTPATPPAAPPATPPATPPAAPAISGLAVPKEMDVVRTREDL